MNGSSFAEGYAIGRDQNGGNGNGTRTFYYYDVMACECEEPGKCN